MKLDAITKLRSLTNSINILKLVIDLKDDEVNKVIALCEKVQKNAIISKETLEEIVRLYVEEVIIGNNIEIQEFLENISEYFKRASLDISEITAYIELIKGENQDTNVKSSIPRLAKEMLNDASVLAVYTVSSHLSLIRLAIEYNYNNEIKPLLESMYNKRYSLGAIKSLIDYYKSCDNLKKKYILRKLAEDQLKKERVYSEDTINMVLKVVKECENDKVLLFIPKILNGLSLVEYASFEIIYNLISNLVSEGYIIDGFNFALLNERTDAQIIAMYQFAKEYNDPEYFLNIDYAKAFTWDEQKFLYINYELNDEKTIERFKRIYKKYTEGRELKDKMGRIMIDILTPIKQELNKTEYETTVGEYLDIVADIDKFIEVLNDNFKSDTNIDSNKKLTVLE